MEYATGARQERCLANVIALANQKGGVGKTTTAINLACFLAAEGYRTLLIDLDPQGNATSSLGVEKRAVQASTYDVLVDDATVEASAVRMVRPNLDLLAANKELAGAEKELNDLTRPHHRLGRALESVSHRYDVTVIDCPPSMGLLTLNGLTAADAVIVPVQSEYLALEGLAEIFNTIELVQQRLNPSLRILGLVMTMFDSRTRLAVDVVKDVHRLNPRRMFNALIPRSIRLAEAPSHGMSIFEYDPNSRGADAYRLLGAEVVQRLGLDNGQPTTFGQQPAENDRRTA
jgi:chromosome partitioning protein